MSLALFFFLLLTITTIQSSRAMCWFTAIAPLTHQFSFGSSEYHRTSSHLINFLSWLEKHVNSPRETLLLNGSVCALFFLVSFAGSMLYLFLNLTFTHHQRSILAVTCLQIFIIKSSFSLSETLSGAEVVTVQHFLIPSGLPGLWKDIVFIHSFPCCRFKMVVVWFTSWNHCLLPEA